MGKISGPLKPKLAEGFDAAGLIKVAARAIAVKVGRKKRSIG